MTTALVVLGGKAGRSVTFWRLPWDAHDGRGGVYMQRFEQSERLHPLLMEKESFLAGLGPEVDLVVQDGMKVSIERVDVEELGRRLE